MIRFPSNACAHRFSSPLLLASVFLMAAFTPLGADETAPGSRETPAAREFDHGSYIYHTALSPDGKWLATDDQIWEVATGEKAANLPLIPREERPYHSFWLAFSPDSQYIAVHRYYDIAMVERATGKELWTSPRQERKDVRESTPRLAFTPDGKHLLSARNDDGLIRVWDAHTGEPVRQFPFSTELRGQLGAPLVCLGLSADSQRVIVHSSKWNVAVLDFATGKPLHKYRLDTNDGWVNFSAVSPDGTLLAYPQQNQLHLMDLATGEEVRTFTGSGDYVTYVSFSSDGRQVAAGMQSSAAKEAWVECWQVATGESLHRLQLPADCRDIAFSSDGKQLLAACADNHARLWQLAK